MFVAGFDTELVVAMGADNSGVDGRWSQVLVAATVGGPWAAWISCRGGVGVALLHWRLQAG